MNRLYSIVFIVLCTTMHSFANNVTNCFSTYKSALGFQVDLPGWDVSEMMQNNMHQFICAQSKNVYIKIYKMDITQSDMITTLTWKIWDIDPNAHFVLRVRTDDGGVIVTTYRNTVTSIHRLRIVNSGSTVFIIECSAPETIFYKYEIYFNRVFQSFAVL